MPNRQIQFLQYLNSELDAAEWEDLCDWMREAPGNAQELAKLSLLELHLREKLAFEELVDAKAMSAPLPDKATISRTALFKFFAKPTPLSMSVAALVIGVVLTAMAFMMPPFYRAITGVEKDGNPQPDSQRIVAELTAVHEPDWAVGPLTPNRGSFLHAGRRLELEKGLAELTFRDGAVVTIEGPSTCVVVSEGVLKLQRGKASAAVPASAVGFRVQTPTAEIIDLSTSFGVNTTQDTTEVYVFQGAVEATLVAADGTTNSAIRLSEGESISWDALAQQVVRSSVEPTSFVRHVPRRKLLEVFSTGRGVVVGQPDPHWTITKAQSDPTFKTQAAIVTALPNAIPNDLDRSQWISNGYPPPNTSRSETYTFRTSINLEGVDPSTATLRVHFAVDNLVRAIRLNGQAVSVPAHEYGAATFKSFMQTDISKGFVRGRNSLEFDVFNADDKSYMGLRVELSGTALEQH